MSGSTVQLTLFTNHLTPNGLKVSIYLEELRTIHPQLEYNIHRLDISKGTHREDWFVRMNPSSRLPLLVDHTRDDFPVFESAAILLYLEANFDPKKTFSFDAPKFPREYSSMIQWVFFGVRRDSS
ncbi:hypothetical protein DXG03_005340 [Asterophora parasitica]|uniref:GST N-terminal domain-containing protein n=1 Tax=Asterophora parasitica TaxID=117018 RepID=A0A9P7G249_9AGAR|nr:hypothetical protein DXG03_005340 [Asterophora parasitica]